MISGNLGEAPPLRVKPLSRAGRALRLILREYNRVCSKCNTLRNFFSYLACALPCGGLQQTQSFAVVFRGVIVRCNAGPTAGRTGGFLQMGSIRDLLMPFYTIPTGRGHKPPNGVFYLFCELPGLPLTTAA